MARCVVVTGSRRWPAIDHQRITNTIVEIPDNVLIEGGALGADRMTAEACRKLRHSFLEIPAPWKGLGRRAGIWRNNRMLDLAPEAVYAFSPIPITTGTRHCIVEALKREIPVRLVTLEHKFVFRSLKDFESFSNNCCDNSRVA